MKFLVVAWYSDGGTPQLFATDNLQDMVRRAMACAEASMHVSVYEIENGELKRIDGKELRLEEVK